MWESESSENKLDPVGWWVSGLGMDDDEESDEGESLEDVDMATGAPPSGQSPEKRVARVLQCQWSDIDFFGM